MNVDAVLKLISDDLFATGSLNRLRPLLAG